MAPVPVRHQRIQADGLSLHAEVTGEGPPVILLHGFPDNARSWRHQVPALASAGFSVWALDLRGYPPSDVSRHRRDYHLRHLVDDVAEVVAATGHARASVVGHDWGGIIAWTFAGEHPALLDRLVILNAPHMDIYARKMIGTTQPLRSAYIGVFQVPAFAEFVLSAADFLVIRQTFRLFSARRDAFSQEEIDHAVATLSHPGALTAALNYYRANLTSDGLTMARSARTEAPVLVIWGERDPALGTFLLDGLERYAPQVRIHRITHASHWVHRDAPEEVNRVLVDFLRATP